MYRGYQTPRAWSLVPPVCIWFRDRCNDVTPQNHWCFNTGRTSHFSTSQGHCVVTVWQLIHAQQAAVDCHSRRAKSGHFFYFFYIKDEDSQFNKAETIAVIWYSVAKCIYALEFLSSPQHSTWHLQWIITVQLNHLTSLFVFSTLYWSQHSIPVMPMLCYTALDCNSREMLQLWNTHGYFSRPRYNKKHRDKVKLRKKNPTSETLKLINFINYSLH